MAWKAEFEQVKETALHYAANQGFLEGMRMLVAYNADVSAVNKVGGSSSPIATFMRHIFLSIDWLNSVTLRIHG